MNAKFVLRAVVFSLAGSILVFLLVGMLLTDSFEVQSARVVSAQPAAVGALVKDFRTWKDWSAYSFDCGAPTEIEVEGEPGTVGHRLHLSGPRSEALFETTAVGDSSLDFRIRHAAKEKGAIAGGTLEGTIEWLPSPDGCKVQWTERGKLEHIIQRWINWFGAHQEMVKRWQATSLSGLETHFRELREGAADGAEPAKNDVSDEGAGGEAGK